MKEKGDILQKIDALLEKLNTNAAELQRISEQVISEEELLPLQKKQDRMIDELTKLDADYHIQMYAAMGPQYADLIKQIHGRLETFQKLNEDFINNLTRGQGVIHFEQDLKDTKKQ